MQEMPIQSWSDFKDLISDKKLSMQFSESEERYTIYACEDRTYLWSVVLFKGSEDSADFENNFKDDANQPLERKSEDGLPKFASAKFADVKNLWLDGEEACMSLAANSTGYMKKHFDFEFTLSGVDCRWYGSNWGDYIDFEVGFYTNEADESTFVYLAKFSNKYAIYGDGSRLFDVPTVKVVPSKVPGTDYNVYIRAKYVNVGSNASKAVLNLVGWK